MPATAKNRDSTNSSADLDELIYTLPPIVSIGLFKLILTNSDQQERWSQVWAATVIACLLFCGAWRAYRRSSAWSPIAAGLLGVATGFAAGAAPATFFAKVGTAEPQYYGVLMTAGLYAFSVPALVGTAIRGWLEARTMPRAKVHVGRRILGFLLAVIAVWALALPVAAILGSLR